MTSTPTTPKKDGILVEVLPGKIVKLKGGRFSQLGDYQPYELGESEIAEESANYGKGYAAGWLGLPGLVGKGVQAGSEWLSEKLLDSNKPGNPALGAVLGWAGSQMPQPMDEVDIGEAMGADTESKEFKVGTMGLPGIEDAVIGGMRYLPDVAAGVIGYTKHTDPTTAKRILESEIWSTNPEEAADKTLDAIREYGDWQAKQKGYNNYWEYNAALKAEDAEYDLFIKSPERLKAALAGDESAIAGTGLNPDKLTPRERLSTEGLSMREKIPLMDENKKMIENDVITAILLRDPRTRDQLKNRDMWLRRREELRGMSREELMAEVDRVFDAGNTAERMSRRGMSVVENASPNTEPLQWIQDTRSKISEAPADLGFKVQKTGKVVGAPPSVNTTDDIWPLVEAYAGRIERALDDGLDPDWFYREGEKAIKRISPDAPTAVQMGEVNAITSSEAPVRSNFGWAVQPYEQVAAGHPVRTGKYPVEASEKITQVLSGTDPHLGEKRHLYGQGLSGVGRQMPPELRRAPNDRWEIRGFGYKGDGAGPAQHKFMHGVRALATDLVNQRRGLNLDVYNGQELNWAVVRADEMNISIAESAKDNIQESIPHYTYQHSWETQPGYYDPKAKDQPLIDVDMPAHDQALQDIYYPGEGNRDELVDIFGGKFQEPPLKNVPGVFEGEVTPYGHQSRSLIYHTDAEGMSQASRERTDATEATRSYFNLQNAAAGSLEQPSKRKTVAEFGGTLGYELGRPITEDETRQVMEVLKQYYDVSEDIGIVPTEKGFRILSTLPEWVPNRVTKKEQNLMGPVRRRPDNLSKHAEEVTEELGAPYPTVGSFGDTSTYIDLPWKERRATEVMLKNLTPQMRAHADSDQMRALAGKLYHYYNGLPSKPPKGFRTVLKTWATSGIQGVEKLVKSGVAPAGVLGILIGQQLMQGESPQQSRGT